MGDTCSVALLHVVEVERSPGFAECAVVAEVLELRDRSLSSLFEGYDGAFRDDPCPLV